jgi:tRNA nucleotidyltransferase/poly(A) polymerase
MKHLILSLILVFFVTSCSSKKELKREIDHQTSQSSVNNPQALGGTIQELIQSSKTLSETKKAELEQLFSLNKQRAEELAAESYKLRAVLVEELLSENRNPKKVKMLKKDIRRIENLRLKNTFDTVEKISKIVADEPDHGARFSDHLKQIERLPNR